MLPLFFFHTFVLLPIILFTCLKVKAYFHGVDVSVLQKLSSTYLGVMFGAAAALTFMGYWDRKLVDATNSYVVLDILFITIYLNSLKYKFMNTARKQGVDLPRYSLRSFIQGLRTEANLQLNNIMKLKELNKLDR